MLVTGGSGFIGSHVVDKVVDAGHDVRSFDETQYICQAGIGIRHAESHAQAAAGRHVKPSQYTLVPDGDQADIISKNVYIVVWRNSKGNF